MGPGKVTTEGGGWITTVESGHCRTQGSLQESARGHVGATPQEGTQQDILWFSRESCKTRQSHGSGQGLIPNPCWLSPTCSLCPRTRSGSSQAL